MWTKSRENVRFYIIFFIIISRKVGVNPESISGKFKHKSSQIDKFKMLSGIFPNHQRFRDTFLCVLDDDEKFVKKKRKKEWELMERNEMFSFICSKKEMLQKRKPRKENVCEAVKEEWAGEKEEKFLGKAAPIMSKIEISNCCMCNIYTHT